MATEQITGYKWVAEQGALNAKNALRTAYLDIRPAGNPNGDGKPYTTTEVVEVQHNTGDAGDFFWFAGDFAPILGNPTVFDVDVDEI